MLHFFGGRNESYYRAYLAQSEEGSLPQYFFHLYNSEVLRDDTGDRFDDAEAARREAVRGISELIAEQIVAGQLVDLRHRIEIEDENGRNVATVRFGDLFQGCANTTEQRASS